MAKLISGSIYGPMKIIKDDGWDKVLIEFIDTGYQCITRRDKIKTNSVKDRLKPVVCGVGYFGEGPYTSTTHKRTYKRWSHMLSRCYTPTDKEFPRYGAKGVTVVPIWHNFQEFAKWVDTQNVPEDYQIDKDIKIKGNLEYGPDSCLMVSPQQNSEAATAKSASFISPTGEIHYTENLSRFAREQGLRASGLSKLYTKQSKTHKGWKLYEDSLD